MTLGHAIAALLALATLVAGARLLWAHARAPAEQRARGWRVAVLVLLQAATALLLYRALFPPTLRAPAGLLVVATANADRVPAHTRPAGAVVVALPEAPALRDATRVPDLATALRRHPGTTRLRVLGAGLMPRDLDAARGRGLQFDAAPPVPGVRALWPPRSVQAGRRFTVAGRIGGSPGARVELLDPAGVVAARVAPSDTGDFRLRATARAAGPTAWHLRVRDRQGALLDETPMPLDVVPATPLRVLVLAGAPNPELKYLRRWARDAGLALDSRIALGAGMRIGDPAARLDPATLAAHDLVVLDARSWASLGAQRAPLLQAVRGGLGLLLQVPEATAPAERAELARLGFASTVARAQEVAPGGSADDVNGTIAPRLTRGPLRVTGTSAAPILPDAAGEPLAWWRASGLGRIGIAGFDDSYRLALAGDTAAHGDLWATLFSTLARPQAAAPDAIDVDAWRGERVVLCGLSREAVVASPDGTRVALQVDPATGARACAGFWPRMPGWHVLRTDDATRLFYVRDPAAAHGLWDASLREATAGLATAAPTQGGAGPAVPGPRWPWYLAWLALAAAGWWFERSRLGRAR